MTWLRAYAGAVVAVLLLDVIWLAQVAGPMFQSTIGPVLREAPAMAPAAAFYLLFAAGITYFAVLPALQRGSLALAARDGAIFGFLAYATFDLTSLAIIKGYTLSLALIDMAWGAFVAGVAAAAGYVAGRGRAR